MITSIKLKIKAILISVFAGLLLAIKILIRINKKKNQKIAVLKHNEKVLEKKNQEDIKRTRFEEKQKTKVEIVNDESELDRLENEKNES